MSDRPGSAAIVPALDEQGTVAGVVAAAAASPLVDEVIVVDGGSSDGTEQRASAAGARVVTHRPGGKGEAMAAGVRATSAGVIVFLDADLEGLRPDHVDRLVRSVTAGGAGMACGLFDRGRRWNWLFLHVGPILTGERAMRRELFESLRPADLAGWSVEAALNARAAELDLPVAAFVCDGLWHRQKEEKFATPWEGYLSKFRMLGVAYGSGVRYWCRARVRRLLRPPPGRARHSGRRWTSPGREPARAGGRRRARSPS